MRSNFFFPILLITIILSSVESAAQQVFTRIVSSQAQAAKANQYLQAVDYYDVDIDELKEVLNKPHNVKLTIPKEDKQIILNLNRTNILTPNYQLHTSQGSTTSTANRYAFYNGTVSGDSDTKVSLVYYDDQFSLTIYDAADTYEINKEGNYYAGYYNTDRLNKDNEDWACTVVEESKPNNSIDGNVDRDNTENDCVTVFFEIDHNMYNKKGSNIANTEAWAVTLFNQVAIMYIEHNVTINISGIQVWDTPDPYTSASNTSQALTLFRNTVQNNPNFNGRLAHLLSGRNIGGGRAYLNTLCSNSFNVAVSGNLNGSSTPYPSYSWNVMVVAHEMGHNMGSNHTQACVWNGNNTAIDGCGDIEGSCADPGNPSSSEGGTIMSYCHLTPIGINLNNGFGPQPGGLIEERFNLANCVTGTDCVEVPPFNDVCDRAKDIPVHNYCINGYYENHATTPSNNGGNMSCGNSGDENDIWYKFIYPDVDTIMISAEATQNITDLIIEVYTGSCGNLSSIDCDHSIAGSDVAVMLSNPSYIGEDLYIRIVEDGSDEEGEFSLCIFSEELPCQPQLDTVLNIYQELDGPNWTDNQGWADGDQYGDCDICDWAGVTCNYLGQIIKLDLSNNNLEGELPADIATLLFLDTLILNHNNLNDTIPNYWDSLSNLVYLDLRDNQLIGPVPTAFSTMDKINTIHLDNNELSDTLPPNIGYNISLRSFTASNNLLVGCFTTGMSSFCYKDSLNLSNNIGLPYNGDVSLLCEEGWGSDWDKDGYCNDLEDCNDYDATINPGVDEVICDAVDNNCNGIIDEGSDFGPNIWIGPDTLGTFSDPANWSLGHIPLICENVVIGTGGNNIHLVISGNGQDDSGQGTSSSLQIRDLIVGSNAKINLPENYNIAIKGSGVVNNDGILEIEGYLSISDNSGTNNTAITNTGNISIIGYGGIDIYGIGHTGIHNTAGATLGLAGYSYVGTTQEDIAQYGINNEGTLIIDGSFTISGSFESDALFNQNGGTIEVKTGTYFYIYD